MKRWSKTKQRRVVLTTLRTLLALYVLTVVTLAIATVAAAKISAAFRGKASGGVIAQPTENPFIYSVKLEGKGKSKLLGSFKVQAHHFIDLQTGEYIDGTITLKSRGGDLFGTYTGYSIPTDAPDVFIFAGSVAFHDGSGRWSGVTGEADYFGEVRITAISEDGVIEEDFDLSMEGTLTFPSKPLRE
jgi:hypothetical protein